MKIAVGPGGKVNFDHPQQKRGTDDSIMQTSIFAGQQMMVIQKSDDEPEVYELHYLGFVADGFNGMESAKTAAPEFARKVLARMTEQIAD